MPLRHIPIAEWPAELNHLLDGAQIAAGSDGARYYRIDADVDARTLLALHEFEAHLRHRRVQFRLPGGGDCVTGEMNPSFGLGVVSSRADHIARVRISFCDLQDSDCIEEVGSQ